jgi:signal transduction histidine kinase
VVRGSTIRHRSDALALENAQLRAELDRQRTELEALYRAEEALHRSLRRQDVLNALVDAAVELLHVDGAALWSPNPENPGGSLPLVARNISADYFEEVLAINRDPAVRELWWNNPTLMTEDALCDPRFPAAMRAALAREGVRALLMTRVTIGEEVFGTFNVGMRRVHAFTETEQRLLATLAHRAALAIHNARVHEESEQRREELEALYHADAALHRSLRVDDVLQTLVDLARSILHADSAGVWTFDADSGRPPTRTAQGVSQRFIDAVSRASSTFERSAIVAAALKSDGAIVVDVATDPRLSKRLRALMLAEDLRTSVNIAIRSGEQVYGLFSLGFTQQHTLSERGQRLFVALAQRAALALQNARLYEQAQQAATREERQRLARELHDAVTQTLFSTALIAEVLPDLWDLDPSEGRQRLRDLQRMTRGALAEMRTLLVELRPGVLTELTLADLVRQLGEATAGRTRLEVSTTVSGAQRELPAGVQIALYRIAQEALNNVVRHAHARTVAASVEYEASGGVRVSVADDGRGFDARAVPAGHLGVGIMRERAEAVGGQFRIVSRRGQGTCIEVHWRPESIGEYV